jgi:RNA binding exosome subunit
MTKKIHNIKITSFSRENLDRDKIIEKLKYLINLDFETEKIVISEENATGLENNLINIISITLTKSQHTKLFFKNLIEKLGEKQKKQLIEQIDSRLDDNLHFFIRLDKDKLFDNLCELTDSGNCFHIMTSIAAFPSKKEIGKKIVEEILNLNFN